ncbi:MAG: PDZ domain-containing protein [Bacteroidales bacterium]
MKRISRLVMIAFMVIIVSGGCKKKIEPTVEVADEISRFIWNGLNEYYLWYQDVDKLSMSYFDDTNEWYTYLNSFGTDYESLFYDLLYQYGTIDRFSWIVDDYVALENSFAGISKTMGYDFRLVRLQTLKNIFGCLNYVIPGSPADIAGIMRGDLFIGVDGESLTHIKLLQPAVRAGFICS